MRIITRDYRKDKGMTLIEIMIALGVFSTVMLIVVNVIRFVGLFTADTLNQVRMAELAQGEIEKIKAGNPPINGNLDYPNSDTPEQSYPVQYNTYPVDARNLAGQILKVTVGSPPDDYFFTTWLPPRKRIIEYVVPGGGSGEQYIMSNWSIDPGNEEAGYGGWKLNESGTALVSPDTAGASKATIYYLKPFDVFDYQVMPLLTYQHNGESDTGLAIYDHTVNKTLLFFMDQHHGKVYVNSTLLLSNQEFTQGTKYYLQAVGTANPDKLELSFGHYDASGNLHIDFGPYVDSSGFYNSTHTYYLGLYDKTAQTEMEYSVPTLGGSGECGM